jgi:hypothetical protein
MHSPDYQASPWGCTTLRCFVLGRSAEVGKENSVELCKPRLPRLIWLSIDSIASIFSLPSSLTAALVLEPTGFALPERGWASSYVRQRPQAFTLCRLYLFTHTPPFCDSFSLK